MKKFILSMIGLLACTAVWAISSPLDLLQTTSNQLITTLQQNQATLKTKPQLVYGIVNQILLPHVDLASMSRIALGRDAWMQASPAQRQAFTQQFTTLLIRTYSSALAQYTDEKVNFLPLRGDFNAETRVQVNSNIIRDSGPAINVSYRLMRVGEQWKLYDFSVDGISLVQSFRSQFAQELQQAGIDGLINKLAQHNAQNN
ncbi:MlaC/ttg2D family ABC transporter substrate-binding protein [Rickettsiella endosymbiont of Dermanyssus gallinae]|uniref:MlaC/ttg2D family ABC transporter substrate-binding protein n=1 Tax=Rickettsiella endosymbiont of Dermanyssus gallinae TaxID=2856608 RepID=UPI001FE2A062|nr:ABC transporter substrate-binding protein [Rickettsiella endosymbiont of Dermanyssus gallinae]